MPKCVSCGKKGLFFKVNKDGRCESCERIFRETERKRQEELKLKAEMDATEEYFQKILILNETICSNVECAENSIQLSDALALLDDKIKMCEDLRSLISSQYQYPKLYDILCQHAKAESTFYGIVPELSLFIWFDRSNSKSETITELTSYPDKLIAKIKRKKFIISKKIEFEKNINSLMRVPITIVHSPNAHLKACDLSEIKYSSITTRTNFERIGTFTVIDVETTGLSCQKDKIIEVSAIYFEYWDPIKCFSTLINPEATIPNEITELTGISMEMVESAPLFSDIIQSLSTFIGTTNIVGHNLEFDLKFLYRNGIDFLASKRKYFDTLQIAKSVLKKTTEKKAGDVYNYKLETLCEYYNIYTSKAHRSLVDCLATGLLFKHLTNDKINN